METLDRTLAGRSSARHVPRPEVLLEFRMLVRPAKGGVEFRLHARQPLERLICALFAP